MLHSIVLCHNALPVCIVSDCVASYCNVCNVLFCVVLYRDAGIHCITWYCIYKISKMVRAL